MRKWIVTLLIFSLAWSLHTPFVQAKSKSMRVALYIHHGSYSLTVPTITLSSNTGLEVRPKGKAFLYLTTTPEQMVRFSPNQYRVLVLDTQQAYEAEAVSMRLSQMKISSSILTFTRNNHIIYRVIAGDGSNYDTALTLLNQIKAEAGLGKEVLGPFALNGGTYANERDAKSQVEAILNAGFDAALGITAGENGQSQYIVVVGNEGTQGELTSLYQEVSLTFPNINFSPIEKIDYALRLDDAIFIGNQIETIPHFFVSPQEVVSVKALPGSILPAITLYEKESRKYRGDMEIQIYNGKMALINELPLEEYLFAVVGAEMASGWPMEALKSQAVIARTYAVARGNKYEIANVTDTTYDQAYYGIQYEGADVRQAVLSTAGEVLTYNGKLIEAFYYSNAGGLTAEGSEVWGNSLPYFKPVTSPDDFPMRSAANWYRIARENGQIGYVHGDYITLTGSKNFIDLPYGRVNDSDVNFRTAPSTNSTSIDKLYFDEYVVILESVSANNAYTWVEGPVDGLTLMNLINSKASSHSSMPFTMPIEELQITQRGPSGRVTEMMANGLPIPARTPDSFRTILGGIRSTKFEVEEMGRYDILGAGGKRAQYPQSRQPLHVISANNRVSNNLNDDKETFVILGKDVNLQVVSKTPAFRFHGQGYGHGLGLSQYGARGLAEQGYDYRQILKHYYSDQITLQKME